MPTLVLACGNGGRQGHPDMKLAIVGGGGFRVPLVYQALLDQARGERLIDQVRLYDTSADRLAVIGSVLRQLRAPGPRVQVRTTTVLDEALDGADFVFSAIRVGGLAGRIADERIALETGVLGQETTGPGGIAYGLRTIPVAMHIANRVRAVAPEAYVINFTNPAGIITEVMQQVLGDRVIGICDTPSGLGARLAGLAGVPAAEVRLDYAGLNHLGWLRAARYAGRDLVAEALADDATLAGLEEAQIIGADWLRTLGMIPNEYLYYYYCNREAVRAITASPQTRGEFLHRQQDEFYRYATAHPDQALDAWQRTRGERDASYLAEARPAGAARPTASGSAYPGGADPGSADPGRGDPPGTAYGGGYEHVALGLMTAIAADRPATMILNVRNDDTLPGLPPDAVVEVPCQVDGRGPRPLSPTPPGGAELGLMQQVKAAERLTIGAALTRDPGLALKALALHPLVDSVAVARDLLAAYRRAQPDLFLFTERAVVPHPRHGWPGQLAGTAAGRASWQGRRLAGPAGRDGWPG
jgi:6-phospho-beta-glucosidase